MKLKLLLIFSVVLAAASLASAQTGTITLWEGSVGGGNVIATVPVTGGTFTVDSAAVTTVVQSGMPIFAQYSGDATDLPSTSAQVIDVVTSGQFNTSVTFTIAPNPATVGQTQTFSGTVSRTSPASPSKTTAATKKK